MFRFAMLLLISVVAGCGGAPDQLLFQTPSSELKVRPSVRTVEVMQVSLPTYAEAQEISVQNEGGTLEQVPGILWADEPARALTNGMVRLLSSITGARIAAEPWPLDGLPEAELTIRVEQLAVLQQGQLRLSGQYGLRYDNTGRRGKLRLFDITVPLVSTSLTSISAGYTEAWTQLAEKIARDL
ncbi:membrane integrity-associated transporter subunit PqiC [Actibacterium sp. 188UL27-1]|uniref:PqiC family protein n=1 Tax=Actibacterium sp. 188UL27-1 TaxID=2786961 RepID=UPI00195AE29E|nr:PqiC family protein [Actibacterium sp. 188UL27-1]MBM7067262.1 membrane integrity-associated transporter subunit PqiC [Actibacterium sp. 188UL27-1]